jgi:exosortase/archaeosortase family protein
MQKDWQDQPNARPLKNRVYDYAKIISFPLTGMLTLLITTWINRGFIEPEGDKWATLIITSPTCYVLTLPAAFLIWLHTMRGDQPLKPYFSLPAALLSLWGFTAAAGFRFLKDIELHEFCSIVFAIYGTLAGLFVSVSFEECRGYAQQQKGRTVLAVFAAATAALYRIFDEKLWYHMCHSSGLVVYWMLHAFHVPINITAMEDNIMLFSQHFTMHLHGPCSGLEGVFIFMFLLSVLMMIDWPLFKRLPVLEIYLLGFIYMFFMNTLRIASLFLIGYRAMEPDASAFMHSMRDAPLQVFHSLAGAVYYMVASGIFLSVLYKKAVTGTVKKTENVTTPLPAKATLL